LQKLDVEAFAGAAVGALLFEVQVDE